MDIVFSTRSINPLRDILYVWQIDIMFAQVGDVLLLSHACTADGDTPIKSPSCGMLHFLDLRIARKVTPSALA